MKRGKSAVILAVLGAAALYWGCGEPAKPNDEPDKNESGPAEWAPKWECPAGVSAGGLDLGNDNLGLESDYVVIKFNNGAKPTATFSDGNAMEHIFDANGEHVTFKVSTYYGNSAIPYNIILKGTAKNGSLRLEDENGVGFRKTLYLNGVEITNPNGPAINIQSNKRTDVHLVGDCGRRNILNGKGAPVDGAGQAKGAVFAEGSLVFGGSGSLEVRSSDRHAVVSDEFIEVESGNIIIYESKSDGIHANERIAVKGGALQIKCEGDAIQNERRTSGKDKTPCPITVSGGKIKIRTTGVKGHGIVSDSGAVIINSDSGAPDINITLTGPGSKGIRARGGVAIDGGKIYLEAYGKRESLADDTSSAAGIRTEGNAEIKKGELTVNCARANENGKGLNIDGDLNVSGGTTTITADGHGIKLGGSLNMSGGYLKSKSVHKKDIDCSGTVRHTAGTLIADNIRQGN